MKRYDPIEYYDQGGAGLGKMQEECDGDWVCVEVAEALQAELDAYKAHVAEMSAAIAIHKHEFPDEALVGDKKLWSVLEQAPAQSLHTIQAQAVTDLITECSYSTQVNGIATSIIDADTAIKYVDRLGEG